MIICFSKNDGKIIRIISGENQIPPFSDELSHVQINANDIIIRRDDKVILDQENNCFKVGYRTFALDKQEWTIITEKNCDKSILLEELN